MAADPSGSIPRQNKRWGQIKGAYRLFGAEQVTYESVSASHWRATRDAAASCRLTLLIQDTTELDFTGHPATAGLGRLGKARSNGGGLGMMLHNVLALEPPEQASGDQLLYTARVLGLAWGKLWCRPHELAPPKETPRQRRQRP